MKTVLKQDTIRPNRLAANAVAGMAATGIYLASRLLLTPLILAHISLAEFGLWSMCFVILSYASMGAFGVNTTYIRYSALFHAKGREQDISGLLSTGVFAMLGFCSLFWLALYAGMPAILDAFKVGEAMQGTAGTMILGTALVFGLDLTLGGFRSVVEGLQEIALVKKIYTAAALVEVAAIVLFLHQGAGVKGLLYAYVVRVFLETAACILAARRLLPGLGLSARRISGSHARRLFIFGGKVQALGGLAIFISSLDRMVITAVIGLSAAGLFEVGRKFPFTAKSVSGAAFGPFLPAAANLQNLPVQGEPAHWQDHVGTWLWVVALAVSAALVPLTLLYEGTGPSHAASWALMLPAAAGILVSVKRLASLPAGRDRLPDGPLRSLYLDGLRHINLINAVLFLFLIAVAAPLITAWVGTGYGDAVTAMRLLAAGYLIQQCTGPVTLIFRGMDRCSREMEYLVIQVVLALAWIPAGAAAFGLAGAAGAIAAGNAVAAVFLFWRSNAFFQVDFRTFARHALKPALVPAALAAAVSVPALVWPCQQRSVAAILVMVMGLAYTGLLVPLVWALVLTENEKQQARALNPFKKREKQLC
jgi:O-antigen/teichoic acid export membrane protein